MIDKVDLPADEVVWVCPSCQADNAASVSALAVGLNDSPDAVGLPACACGARTTVQRTWETTVDAPHRRAINSLVEHLIAEGKSLPGVKAAHDAEVDVPPLMADLSSPIDDLTGRKKAVADAAAAAVSRAQWEAERPAREAAEAAAKAQAEEEEGERLFALATIRRETRARANVNKRLGLPPGSEPPADELAAEMAKHADELAAGPSVEPAAEVDELQAELAATEESAQ
jgi:hypothetical protein